MIPLAHVQQWTANAPWPDLRQVEQEGHPISRANAEERMLKKLNQSLTEDVAPLLPAGVSFTDDEAIIAFGRVWGELIRRIPGDPWKSTNAVVEAIRKSKVPTLLHGVHE